MKNNLIREAIPAVVGRVIASAFVLNEKPDAHGVLLIFADGTELSVNFSFQMRVDAEDLHIGGITEKQRC